MSSFRPMQLAILSQLFGLSLASHELFARQTITSYSPAETASCLNLAQSCDPTIASCTPTFCSSCAAVAGPDFVSCCAGTDAAGCISTFLATVATPTGSGAAATTTPDPNVVACKIAVDFVASCADATPGFSTMLAGAQASCLCYTSTGTDLIYAPRIYDSAQMGCVNWAKTADTSDYPIFASVEGMCSAVGNVRSANATTTTAGSGSTSSISQLSSGGAVSTRTASVTSTASSSKPTGSVVTATSSAAAAAIFGKAQDRVEAPWGLGYLLLGLGWLV